MIRRPPRSTLFPTRRSSDLGDTGIRRSHHGDVHVQATQDLVGAVRPLVLRRLNVRSEEHTSELQSHSDLVCRLLLEKKKNCTDVLLQTTHDTKKSMDQHHA